MAIWLLADAIQNISNANDFSIKKCKERALETAIDDIKQALTELDETE